jgi:hypothetical protein
MLVVQEVKNDEKVINFKLEEKYQKHTFLAFLCYKKNLINYIIYFY